MAGYVYVSVISVVVVFHFYWCIRKPWSSFIMLYYLYNKIRISLHITIMLRLHLHLLIHLLILIHILILIHVYLLILILILIHTSTHIYIYNTNRYSALCFAEGVQDQVDQFRNAATSQGEAESGLTLTPPPLVY